MIVIGALIWLVIALAYAAAVGGAWAVYLFLRKKAGAWTVPSRILAALSAALVMGPIGCAAIYVPLRTESGRVLKPRFTENIALAYLVPLALSFIVGLYVTARLSKGRNNVSNGVDA